METQKVKEICDRINDIFSKRIQGIRWFQFFNRLDGKPIEHLGVTPSGISIQPILDIAQKLVFLATNAVIEIEKIDTRNTQLEELVIVGQMQKLFIFPFQDIVLAIMSSEKIGDVCFHTSWAGKNPAICIKPHLKPLIRESFVYPNSLQFPSQDLYEKTQEFLKINELAQKAFYRPPFFNLVINQQQKTISTAEIVDKSGQYDLNLLANIIVSITSLVGKVEALLKSDGIDLGVVQEIILGRTGPNERHTSSIDGSVIVLKINGETKLSLVLGMNDFLGRALYATRWVEKEIQDLINK
ncbi:MAG: hypothetical protein ABSE89_11270 [Sedimentisphaerales bacterium]